MTLGFFFHFCDRSVDAAFLLECPATHVDGVFWTTLGTCAANSV